MPIFPHNKNSGPFSQESDSGSIIVSATDEFVGLLTGGLKTPLRDPFYATLFEWLWNLVQEEFPGANLYFDNL
jgi:hypothetical protein